MKKFRKKDLFRRPVERIVKNKNTDRLWSRRLYNHRGQLLSPSWMKGSPWNRRPNGQGKNWMEKRRAKSKIQTVVSQDEYMRLSLNNT